MKNIGEKVKILIATGNAGKKAELLSFFEDLDDIEWLDFADFPNIQTIVQHIDVVLLTINIYHVQ